MADAGVACSGCRDGDAFAVPFAMAFQPIVEVASGRVFAYEALVRGPEGQGAATVLDAVTPDNRYAFDQQCRVVAIEQALAAGLLAGDARLSINFLPNAVYSPLACIQLTLRTAAANNLPPSRLIFEFTEGEEMLDTAHVENIIDTYKRIGFGTAIDDFGAGYAGLNLLARFRPDIIKIDMGLVRDLDSRPRQQEVVRATVAMCRALDTLLVAEGVETERERAALSDLGIEYMQGYLFAKPGFRQLPQPSVYI